VVKPVKKDMAFRQNADQDVCLGHESKTEMYVEQGSKPDIGGVVIGETWSMGTSVRRMSTKNWSNVNVGSKIRGS
jgi:hypothetical protein